MAKEINSDLLRGNINTIILKALYNGDRYGYDIVRDIEIKSHGQYTIKQPTLYSCLKRLESQGFVSSYWGTQSNGGRRKYFSLTDMGREVFKQSQDDYEYSRTIIDKLISEDRYDLGDYTPSQSLDETEFASSEQETAPSADAIADDIQQEIIDTQPSIDQATDTVELQDQIAPISQSEAEEAEDLLADQADSVSAIEENLISTQTEQETPENDQFIEYISVSNDNSADYIIDEDLSQDAILDSQTEDNSEEDITTFDNSEDVASILNSQSSGGSYINNIETSDAESSSSAFATMFSSDVTMNNDDADLFGTGEGLGSLSSSAFDSTASEEDNSQFSTYSGSSDSAEQLQNQFESLYDLIENQQAPESSDKKDEFISYDRKNDPVFSEVASDEEQSDEYQNKLGDIIENFYNPSSIELTREQISISALELNNKVQIKPFGSSIVDSARELGEEVHVRAHDNTAKSQYATRYYYRSNYLRLFVNAVLLITMLAESFIFWMIFKNGVGANGKYDTLIYVLSILVSLVLPIYAGIRYGLNPHAKKRIENDFNSSIVFKLVVMVLICVLSFLIHLYLGMPLSGNISDYVVSLFMPMILSTNLPLSSLIFKLLYKSPYFMIKE